MTTDSPLRPQGTGPGQPRSRGRPRDPAKREAILDAARRLFLAHGADATPLDAVIGAAGVSRANFYANFHDRSQLLEALIRRESERIVGEAAPEDLEAGSLEAAFVAFGERLLRLLADPDMVGFERVIAAAVGSHPELPGRFYEAGPGRAHRRLAQLVAKGVRSGQLEVEDADAAAEDLMGLWQGMMRVQLTMGSAPTPDGAARRRRAERGVALFMRLYGAASGRPT